MASSAGHAVGPLQRPAARTKTKAAKETEVLISRELSLSEWAKQEAEDAPSSLSEVPSTSGEDVEKSSWLEAVTGFLTKSSRKKRELRARLHEEGLVQIAAETLSFWQKIWHYVFVDPYERVNVWSHGLGALFFLCYAIWGRVGRLFSLCACMTHLLSVGAHIYPGSLMTEKLDHLGIVFLIVGTPLSIDEAFGWRLGGRAYAKYIVPAIGSAAVLPDEPRVVGFVVGSAALLGVYQHLLWEVVMLAELALYLSVAFLFLKGGNHHRSKWALADHHIAHYCVTIASVLHLVWLHFIRAESMQGYQAT